MNISTWKIHDYIWHNLVNHESIISTSYCKYTMNQVHNLQKNSIQDQAIKRHYEEWISIDWIESLDLDDAIWCEKTSFWYAVFVHISDVTEFIQPYSPLDLEALTRTTSIYRSSWVINMFPEYLSQNIMSLNEDWTKLTLTLKIELDNYWEIINYDVYESIFKNLKRYNYEDFIDDYINPYSQNHRVLQTMYELASKRRAIRKTSWAIQNYDESDRDIYIWEKQQKQIDPKKSTPKIIIEEFMILSNIVAATIWVKNKYNTIFRNHYTLDERALYSNRMDLHKWLALDKYTHFTSPIRRYADIIVHRILKIVHLRKEESPYTTKDILDIANHINQVKSVIKIIWQDIDLEQKWAIKVLKIKQRKEDWNINTSDFTKDIRENVWNMKKMPKIIIDEIIKDIQFWDKWSWAWAIWVFLVSWNDEIKKAIKKAILEDKKFRIKALFSILNNTKILNTDLNYIFSILEKKEGNTLTIETYFRWEILFSKSINIWYFEEEDAWGRVRTKTIESIINHFC